MFQWQGLEKEEFDSAIFQWGTDGLNRDGRRLLKTVMKTKILAIRVGVRRTIHSLGGVNVSICLCEESVMQHCGVLDTDAFDIVIGTDFLRKDPQLKMISLQHAYALHCDFGNGLFSVPLELSGRRESGLRYAARTNYRTEKLPVGPTRT